MSSSDIYQWLAEYDQLAELAMQARSRAYAPYSRFSVGAALLTTDGQIYTGCNIENSAYPVGLCAERAAFARAISAGSREFSAIAIAGGPDAQQGSDFCSPCGMCRQFMREFCGEDFQVILIKSAADSTILDRKIYRLGELLADSFGPQNLR